MVERVLVQQVGLVEQEYRVEVLLGEVVHALAHRVEDGRRGGAGAEAERDAELVNNVNYFCR